MALTARRRRQAAAAAVVLLVLGLHALGLRAWVPTPAAAPHPSVASPAAVSPVAPTFVPMQVRALVPTPPPAGPEPREVAAPAPAVVRVAAGEAADTGADGATRRAAPAEPPARRVAARSKAVQTEAARTEAAQMAAAPAAAPTPAPPPVVPGDEPSTPAAADPGLPTAAYAPVEAWPPAVASAPSPPEADDTLVAQARTAPPAARPPGEAPPVYPTKLPPSFQWTFRMQRGILAGTGKLGWELNDARYRLALVGTFAGVNLLEWVSVGGIDRAGVAPERFVSQARGRSAQATNFQRGAGKVTYSSSTAEHPLPPGVQDRVSWLVQLAAVVAAAPERYAAPGTPLALPVAGTRDVGLWQFVALGPQAVETPAGRVEALALRREAKRAYDTRGEVWLDPQRHHLPVRVVLSTIDGNGRVSDSLAFALESTTP